MWEPSCPLHALQARASMNQHIREFFSQRKVLEVETPILATSATCDPQLESFVSHFRGPTQVHNGPLYLQTSPEYFMKRLLASGSGDIYQISKVFRNEEVGKHHNPEFTMLEWYRLGFDHFSLMDEVSELIQFLADQSLVINKMSYRETFLHYLDLDVQSVSVQDLNNIIEKQDIKMHSPLTNKDECLNLLLSLVVEPKFPHDELFFLYHYPKSQAALAKVIEEESMSVGCRFELYWQGLELANGFYELRDANEQRRRFEQDLQDRRQQNKAIHPIDDAFLNSVDKLPDCSGVAVGLDRVLMCLLKCQSIDEVLSFDLSKV